MIDGKSDFNINSLKPEMKLVNAIAELEVHKGMVAMAKADGEFSLLKYERNGESFLVNRYGHMRKDFPAFNEAIEALNRSQIDSAEILCELYAVDDDGKPLNLPNLIRFSKGKEKRLNNVHIGTWDLHRINGKSVTLDFDWKLQEMSSWFEGCKLVYVLPWIKPKSKMELLVFWGKWVEQIGYEGVVVRDNAESFKVKPCLDVDAVIIALNKVDSTGNSCKRWGDHAVSSVRVALMDEQGFFVEIGDCTIADREIQQALWQLHEFKVSEDPQRVYIRPMVIMQVKFTSLFKGSICRKFSFNKTYIPAGQIRLWKMRNPRFLTFRKDKQVNSRDLRLNQIEVG